MKMTVAVLLFSSVCLIHAQTAPPPLDATSSAANGESITPLTAAKIPTNSVATQAPDARPLAIPHVIYQLPEQPAAGVEATHQPLLQLPNRWQDQVEGPQSETLQPSDFTVKLGKTSPGVAAAEMTQSPTFERGANTPLDQGTFEVIDHYNSVRSPTDSVGLVEWLGHLFGRSKPAHAAVSAAAWSEPTARFPRDDRFVREPGLRLVSLHF